MNERARKKGGALALLRDPRRREKLMLEMNRENMDNVGPVGGTEQGMNVLSEMNDLEAGHDEFVKSLASRVEVL